MSNYPTLAEISATAERISGLVFETPTLPYFGSQLGDILSPGTDIWLKLELFQRTGSFKPRGALNVIMNMPEDQLERGVAAFSAGNHAIATAYAAKTLGVSAKVVMPKSANPFRVERCQALGADIVFADDMAALHSAVERLQKDEGRALVHPFEGPRTFEGTGTIGLELCNAVEELDAVIVPIGGGGLISGIASAVKQAQPNCLVFGVEPEGAKGMSLSLAAGEPVADVPLSSIADSLSAPFHTPLAFSIIKDFVDEIVTVPDEEIVTAMRFVFSDLKLAVEPAAATTMAALLGPLKSKLSGKRTALILCGTNIDPDTYGRFTNLA